MTLKCASLLAAVGVAALLGCGPGRESAPAPAPPAAAPETAAPAAAPAAEPATMPAAKVAVAELQPLGESGVSGKVTFTEKDGEVQVEAHINGLAPGDHGFHVHDFGDCSAADGSTAGGHFNPTGAQHGALHGEPPSHAGDLGNVTADASGHAMVSAATGKLTLGEGPTSILGRGVIVHEKADDLTTQPTGDSGGRLACGVVRLEGGDTQPVLPPPPAATP
jgi:Cu-Zn family superoxide dismutase